MTVNETFLAHVSFLRLLRSFSIPGFLGDAARSELCTSCVYQLLFVLLPGFSTRAVQMASAIRAVRLSIKLPFFSFALSAPPRLLAAHPVERPL